MLEDADTFCAATVAVLLFSMECCACADATAIRPSTNEGESDCFVAVAAGHGNPSEKEEVAGVPTLQRRTCFVEVHGARFNGRSELLSLLLPSTPTVDEYRMGDLMKGQLFVPLSTLTVQTVP